MARNLGENIEKLKDLSSRTLELLLSLQRTYHSNVLQKVEKLIEEGRKEMKEKIYDEKLARSRRDTWIKAQLEQITSAIWKDVRSKMVIVNEEKSKELESLLSALEQKHLQDMEKLRHTENCFTEKLLEQAYSVLKRENEYQSPCHLVSKSCLACGNTNILELFVCSGCKRVLYCNEVCQRSDWNRHQHDCSEET